MYITKYIQRRCLVLLDYIWIDGDLPILSQLPNDFNSAAILFHPFIQMPSGWEKSKRANPYQHIYPNDEYKKLPTFVGSLIVFKKTSLHT